MTRSRIEPLSAWIIFVQDLKNSKLVDIDQAEKLGIINFTEGTYRNTSSSEVLKINDAIEKGLIVVENKSSDSILAKSFDELMEPRKRSSSRKSKSMKSFDALNTTAELSQSGENLVEMGQQFSIVSILDPARRVKLTLEEAISAGVFDINSATYLDTASHKKLTLVDAIDLGLVKIANKNFQASYKLNEEEESGVASRGSVKNAKTYSIRYVLDSFSDEIVPLNIAASKNLVNLENGTYKSADKLITLREAYEKCYAFTKNDLDNANSIRARFQVEAVRKSTTRKNMSVRSALAKNWVNVDRRVYVDKQTNEEMPFSQAVDLDLLVLKGGERKSGDSSAEKYVSAGFKRNVSGDSFNSGKESSARSVKSSKSNLESFVKQKTKNSERNVRK